MKTLIALAILCSCSLLDASVVKTVTLTNYDLEYLAAMIESFSKGKEIVDFKVIARGTETCGIHYTSYSAIILYRENL